MGNRLDLEHMLNLPTNSVICPNCGSDDVNTWNDEYDIENGSPNPRPGLWVLLAYCHNCEWNFNTVYKVTSVEVVEET